MSPEWTLAYSTTLDFQAALIKEMLEDQGVVVVLVNKKDSSYIIIGDIEIYVSIDDLIRAKHLIKKFFESGESN